MADTFIGKDDETSGRLDMQRPLYVQMIVAHRYGGRVTVEEVLDSIFQKTAPSNIPSDPT